jgi:hypothetical protein
MSTREGEVSHRSTTAGLVAMDEQDHRLIGRRALCFVTRPVTLYVPWQRLQGYCSPKNLPGNKVLSIHNCPYYEVSFTDFLGAYLTNQVRGGQVSL